MKNIYLTSQVFFQQIDLKRILFTIMAIFMVVLSFAATITSTGGGGNWNNAGTWVGGVIPGPGDNVVIAGNVTVTANASCTNVTINSGATLTCNNAGLTVSGNWTNNGTFNGSPSGSNGNPGAEIVTFTGAGATIGGSSVSHFCSLVINPGAGNTITMTASAIEVGPGQFSNSTLTLQSGTFDVGAGNSITFVSQQGGGITSNGGNFKSYGPTGWTLKLKTAYGSTFNTTGNVTLDNVIGLGMGGNYGYSLQNNTANGLKINGMYTVSGDQSQSWGIKGNAPIWGASSTLYRDFNNMGYTLGQNGDLSWTAHSGTIGVTPGYPNNVTYTNMGASNGNSTISGAGMGWIPPAGTTIGLNGTLQIGDGKTNGQVSFENVTNFNSGGLIVNNTPTNGTTGLTSNSVFISPKSGATFIDRGDFMIKGSPTGNNFLTGGSTINFAGSGTSGSPQKISTPSGAISFTNMTVSNGTYVQLQSPVTVTGTLNLTSGYIGTTSTNLLTISNTATNAINGGSSTAFVDGPLAWTLPATTSGNYTFPIGSGGTYLPLTLSPNSTSGATVTATAFNQNSGGSPDATVTSLSTTEYWSVSTSSPFSSGPLVSVTRNTPASPNNALAVSSSASGVYTAIGGTPSGNTISGGGIGTNSPAFITMVKAPLSVVKLSGTNVTCNGTTGSLTVGGSGGTAPYTFSVDGGAFQAGATFTPLAPGDHLVTVKDAANTTATATLKVLGSLVINGDDKDVSICSGASTTLTANNLLNTTPTYSWSTSKTGAPVIGTNAAVTVSPTTTTTYYVTSKLYNNNLMSNGSFESGITGFTSSYNNWNGQPQYATTPGNNGYFKVSNAGVNLCQYFVIGANAANGSLTAQQGGSYFIGDGATASSMVLQQTINGLTSGEVYKFQYWYAAANPDGTRAQLRASINGTALGTVTTTNDAGWTQATYTWTATGASATIAITNLTATGSTNGNDFYIDNMEFLAPCTVTDSIKVIVSTATPGTVSANQTVCAGATPNALNLTGNTNTTIVRWERATNAGFTTGLTSLPYTTTTLTGANTGISALPVGTYYFRVVESGCGTTINSTTATITVTNPVTPTFTLPTEICNGSTAPTLPTSSTNTPAITGTWNPATVSNTADGTYTFTPDAGQCATTTTATIKVNPLPTPTVANKTICSGDPAATFDAGAGYAAYAWSANGSGTAQTTSGTAAGNYTVQVTDAKGCKASATGTLTVNPLPTPTVASKSICAGDPAATFDAGAGYTAYSWSGNGTGTAQTTSGTAAGNYIVQVTDANGCKANATGVLTVNALPTPTVASKSICAGDPAATFDAGAGYSAYAWSGNGSGTAQTTSGTTAGDYTVQVTDAKGCKASATGTLTVNPVLTPTVSCGTSTNTSVQFNWTAVTGATGYSLSYKVNGGAATSGGTTASTTFALNSLNPADVVDITVTPTGTGCFAAGTGSCTAYNCSPITVTVPADITICNGGTVPSTSFTSNPAGATYKWTNSNTAIGLAASGTGDINSFTATNTTNSPITATITVVPTIAPCSGTPSTYTITVNPTVTPTFAAIPDFCEGATAPALPASSTNTPAITGTWNPSTVSNTASGTYTFTPDAGQCAVTTTLNVNVIPNVTPTFAAIPPFCEGTAAPALPASSTNTPAITGTWNPSTVSNTASGTYTFTPDAGQCATTATQSITVNPIITPVISCGTSSNSTIEFNWNAVTGATGYALSYTQNGGPAINAGTVAGTSFTATSLNPGDAVELTVTPQGNGCFNPGKQTCMAIPCSPITVKVPNDTVVCNGSPIPATNFVSTPAGASFAWTSVSSTGQTLSGTGNIPGFNAVNPGTSPITVTVTVTPTISPCTGTPSSYKITVNPTVTPTFTQIPPFCEGGTPSSTLQSSSTNTPAITGSWSPATIDNTASAAYTFTPDAGQCAVTTTMNITVIPNVTPTFNALSPFCEGATAPALLTSSTNTPAITGTWNPPVVSNTQSATYTFTPDAGQCALTTTLDATVIPNVTPKFPQVPAFCSGTTAPAFPTQTNTPAIGGTWTPSVISNQSSGTYTFKPNAGQCAVDTAISVTVNPKPVVVVGSPSKICIGDTTQVGSDNSIAGYTYKWTTDKDGIINDATSKTKVVPTKAGNATYTLTVTGQGGCQSSDNVVITVLDSFKVDAGPDVLVCSGETVQLEAMSSSAISYKWNNGANGAKVKVVASKPENYVVIASNGACLATDTVMINVKDSIFPTLYIPNTFTPNADKLNEEFKAYGEGVTAFEGNIFNRWGELIYHWDDIDAGWDGKQGATGVVSLNEVYIYTIRVKNECQKDFGPLQKGTIKVIK